MELRRHLPLLLVSVVTLTACSIPIAIAVFRAWGVWQGIPLAYIGDALFYLARIKAVAGGDLFFANTFYVEHAHGVAISFSISEWLAAIPYALTHSWGFSIISNIFFWALAFSILSYFVFRLFDVGEWISACGALLMLSQAFLGFFRPVVMQVPFAMFALLLFAVALFLAEPQRKSRIVLVALAGAIAVYTYTFLGQLVVAFLAVLFVSFLCMREWGKARSLLFVGLGSVLLLVPLVFLLFAVIHDPNYLATLVRYELVHSHIPNPEVYFFGRWMVLVLIVWAIVWRYAKEHLKEIDGRRILVGCSLAFGTLLVLLSPIVTGTDIQGAGHVGRFVPPILAINTIFFIAFFQDKDVRKALAGLIPANVLFVLVLLAVFGLVQNTFTVQIPLIPSRKSISAAESYAPVLGFLSRQKPASVVWADETLSSLMFVSGQYVLSAPFGSIYLISTPEVQERYLISQYPSALGTAQIVSDADANNFRSVDARDANNRSRSLCRVLARLHIGSFNDCPALLDYQQAMGSEYFVAMLAEYQDTIVPHINDELDRFHVRFIVRDRENDIPLDPVSVGAKQIYDDGRFIVYERPLL